MGRAKNPLITPCGMCGTPTKVSQIEFDLDSDTALQQLCKQCSNKAVVAAKLGRDLNEKEPPAFREGYTNKQNRDLHCVGWDIPGIESVYFASLYACGGIYFQAAREAGININTVQWRRANDEEFARKEQEIIIQARTRACKNVEDNVYKLAMGELIYKTYDEEAYDLEIPDYINTDELTLDQLARICTPVPRHSGYKAIPPNFAAMVKYLQVYHPEWRQAKKETVGDVSKFVDKLVEKLLPLFQKEFGDVPAGRIRQRLMSYVEDDMAADVINRKYTEKVN